MPDTITPPATGTLPTEIWDAIVAEIDDPSDLVNVARTCTTLYSVVDPEHLQYRAISSRIDNMRFWTELSLNHVKARSLRTLVLQDIEAVSHLKTTDLCVDAVRYRMREYERQTRGIIPRSKGSLPGNSDWAISVNLAVASMSRLRTLALCVHTCQLRHLSPLFEALSPDLEIFYIDAVDETDDEQSEEDLELCLQVLSLLKGGYRSFSFTLIGTDHDDAGAIVEHIISLLQTLCSTLEHLRVVFDCEGGLVSFSRVVKDSAWPRLRSLELSGVDFSLNPNHQILSQGFWLTHIGLTVLRFFDNHDPPTIPPLALPNLRVFETDDDCSDFMLSALAPMPDGSYRPIETLGLRLLGNDAQLEMDATSVMADFCCDVGKAEKLHHLLVIFNENTTDGYQLGWLKLFGRCIPSILTLNIQFVDHTPSDFPRWVHMLSRFPNLQTLDGKEGAGFLSYFEIDRLTALTNLATSCPQLVKVDRWFRVMPRSWSEITSTRLAVV